MSDVRVMAGIVSCRPRPPWLKIRRLIADGARVADVCLEYGVTKAEVARETRGVVTTPAAPATLPIAPVQAAVRPEPAPTVVARKRHLSKRPPITTEAEVRRLLESNLVSWNEAAWLLKTTVKALRARAADEDWQAPVKVRRRAPREEAALVAKVKVGRCSASAAAAALSIPVEVVQRRVRRA